MSGQLTNITNEPPYIDSKLKVYIFGLGTLWFDQTNDQAGFGFIDVPDTPHPLTVEICENGQIIFSEEIPAEKTIYISGDSANLGMGNQYHSANHPQEDDPNKPADDFRWMIDLDSYYHPALAFVTKPPFYARLEMTVGDAIFFTEHKSPCDAVLENSTGLPVGTPAPVGQVIGFCSEKTGSELRIDTGSNLLTDPNASYTVIIRYHCSAQANSNPVNSDFIEIYDVIHDDGTLEKYNLAYADQVPPWIAGCEMTKMRTFSENIAAIFDQNPSLSLAQMNEIAAKLDYINHRLSCELACQDVIFGKYSKTVS